MNYAEALAFTMGAVFAGLWLLACVWLSQRFYSVAAIAIISIGVLAFVFGGAALIDWMA